MAARKGSGFPFPAQPDPPRILTKMLRAEKLGAKRRCRASRQKTAAVLKTRTRSGATTQELRKIHQRIQKHHKRLRERYKEIRGKRVDWIEYWSEEGLCFFSVRFTDGKEFSIVCHPDIVTDSINFSDWKTGDEVILRKYYRRREH